MIPPRIAIISDEGPQTGSAGGLLLARLLADHPPERLYVLAQRVPTVGLPLPGVDYHALETPWRRFEQSRFNRLKRSLRAFGCVPKTKWPASLDSFQPDVILCVMQHAACYDTAADYARRKNLPLVVIVHDVNDSFEPVLPWARAAAKKKDAAFYQQAAFRLCVSPEMEQYLHDHLGSPGQVLYPNRNPNLQPRPFHAALTLRRAGQLTLGFAGNVNYGYGREICRLLPALRNAGARLVVYSHPPGTDCRELLQAADCVELRGFLPDGEVWNAIQRDCDAVWLPYPFHAPDYEALYRTHFPSKLPEYLALGMPVIVSGPEYATGVRWAIKNNTCVCASVGSDPETMTGILRDLTRDPQKRNALAQAGWEAGQRDFDPGMLVQKFKHCLAMAASAHRDPSDPTPNLSAQS